MALDSLLAAVAQAMIDEGYGTTLGTDIFTYGFKSIPITAYCIFPLDHGEPTHVLGGSPLDYPGFQIQVRRSDTERTNAYNNLEAIRKLLDGQTIAGGECWATRSQPEDLTNDADMQLKQVRFSVDFRMLLERI